MIKPADGEFLDLYLKLFKKILFTKNLWKKNKKSKIKLDSEHLF